MDRERYLVEKEVKEVVADADSPIAQRHIRESMKKNKFTLFVYAVAFITPIAFLSSFYFSKYKAIRAKFKDPYALPEGFDPVEGTFAPGSKMTSQPPPSLVLGAKPGSSHNKS
ncbi:hypothetical protein ADEAN_000490300 [Angomonas deanei]|uniref:Transmembrane protein n=1 Tax=Angomonas deanei TaxID=59799 RepID=A0A7G2CDC5_9TRYP|nr:hypothetical protein ADEAN_000490300 [Angomonas deanei]